MKIHTREPVLAALQLPLAGFIAGAANAQSPQQLERLETLVRAQAAQIEKLSAEMKTLKKGQSKTSQLAQPASPPAEKKVESKTSQQAQTASPPAVKTPGAMGSPQFGYPDYVVAGDKKLSWKLPGSDVSLRIGGYAKLDAIGITGGNRSVGASDQFNVFQIQTRGTPPTGTAPGDPSTRIHARQSRINIEASKTETPFGPARVFFEADFFGPIDLGTQTVSNSSTFRLRHAYGELGPVLAGQTWSTFIDPSTYAEILDFTGPGGESFARQGQVRYTHNFGGGFTGAIAVENPQSRIRIGEGPVSGTGAAPAATGLQVIGVGPFARDSTPDFIARIKYESPQFNLQLSGVGTRSTAPPPTAAVPFVPGNGHLGFGVLASGQIALPLFNNKDNFRFQAGYLDGASRYLLDVSSTTPSVAYDATLTQFDSIKAYGGFGALQHWWTDTLRTNLVYSVAKIDNPIFSGPAVARETQYGVVNLIYSPWPEVDIGAEYQYGRRTDADGRSGYQTRIQSSLIYRF
ncbi:Porin subfamily protein [Bradyrhizobium erythrophlei]|nr:Porin subfamily protein [Bradyrhizobium erythrophlei]